MIAKLKYVTNEARLFPILAKEIDRKYFVDYNWLNTSLFKSL